MGFSFVNWFATVASFLAPKLQAGTNAAGTAGIAALWAWVVVDGDAVLVEFTRVQMAGVVALLWWVLQLYRKAPP